eukprot:jgi/Mesvir1/29073/Mv18379-RA.2
MSAYSSELQVIEDRLALAVESREKALEEALSSKTQASLLADELQSKKRELESCTAEKESKTQELLTTLENLEGKTTELSAANENLAVFAGKIADLERDCAAKQQQLDNLNAVLSCAEERCMSLTKEVADLVAKADNITCRLEASLAENCRLQQAREADQVLLSEQQQKADGLQTSLLLTENRLVEETNAKSLLCMELETARAKAAEEAAASMATLKCKEEEIQTAVTKIAEVLANKAHVQNELLNTQGRLSEAESALQAAGERIAEVTAEKVKVEDDLASAQVELTERNGELESAKRHQASLAQELEDAQKACAEEHLAAVSVKNDLTLVLKAKCVEHDERVKELIDLKAEREQEQATYSSLIDEMKLRESELVHSLKATQADVERHLSSCKKLEQRLATEAAEQERLKAELSTNMLAQVEQAASKLRTEVEHRMATAGEKLSSLESAYKAYVVDNAAKLQASKLSARKLKLELDATRENLTKAEAASVSREKESTMTLDAAAEERAKLQAEVVKFKADLQALQEDSSSKAKELAQTKRQLTLKQKESKAAEDALRKESKKKMDEMCQELNGHVKEHTAAKQAADKEIAALKEQLAKLTAELAAAVAEKKSMSEDLKHAVAAEKQGAAAKESAALLAEREAAQREKENLQVEAAAQAEALKKQVEALRSESTRLQKESEEAAAKLMARLAENEAALAAEAARSDAELKTAAKRNAEQQHDAEVKLESMKQENESLRNQVVQAEKQLHELLEAKVVAPESMPPPAAQLTQDTKHSKLLGLPDEQLPWLQDDLPFAGGTQSKVLKPAVPSFSQRPAVVDAPTGASLLIPAQPAEEDEPVATFSMQRMSKNRKRKKDASGAVSVYTKEGDDAVTLDEQPTPTRSIFDKPNHPEAAVFRQPEFRSHEYKESAVDGNVKMVTRKKHETTSITTVSKHKLAKPTIAKKGMKEVKKTVLPEPTASDGLNPYKYSAPSESIDDPYDFF